MVFLMCKRAWAALFCAMLMLFNLTAFAASDSSIVELKQGEFVFTGDSADRPSAQAAWQPITLPDLWDKSRLGSAGNAWYRFRFALSLDERQGQIQAVYVPRWCMNGAVYLNGVLIGDGGRMQAPVARNWNRPQLFLIPPGVARHGENTLEVYLVSLPYSQGSLFPFYVGPEAQLHERYEQRFFIRITLNQTITLIIAAIGLLMLSLWWRRRQDTMYAYFGASALVWSLNSLNLYIKELPVSHQTWEIFVNSSLPMFITLLMISLLRFMGKHWRYFERALWAIFIAAPVSLAMVPEAYFFKLTPLFFLCGLVATVIVSLALLRHGWRQRDVDTGFLGASIWIGFLFGAHDWLMHSKLLWYANPTNISAQEIHLVHYAAPLVFLMVGWIMTARFVRVLNNYEQLTQELEQRVASKHAELERNFTQLEAMTKEQAMMDERQRIVADMHDGLGGQLVTALRLVEGQRVDHAGVAQLLRECLDDMRIVMNSITPGENDLDAILGSLRYRLTPRFEQAGIELEWQFDGALDDYPLTPQQALHVQRILQECFTNILKHAGASRITVINKVDQDGKRCVVISDNGRGIQTQGQGRGFANMQNRAARLGAALTVDSTESGVTVVLCLPPVGKG